MTASEFCYWLKGYFELLGAGPKSAEKPTLTAEQVEMIEQHLNYVFAEKVKQERPPITLGAGMADQLSERMKSIISGKETYPGVAIC